MRLKKITVENFRCFKKLDLDFHPKITVLIAANGAGKTAILDAARASVWPFIKAFDLGSQTGKSATIQIDDVRREKSADGNMEFMLPSKIIAYGVWEKDVATAIWTQTREKIKSNTNTIYDVKAKKLIAFGKKIQKKIQSTDLMPQVSLPIIAYLGTGRLWYQGRHTSIVKNKKLNQGVFSRTWGYYNCITASSNYKQFEEWFTWIFRSYREQQNIHIEKKIPLGKEALRFQNIIKVIQTTVNKIIQINTGWHDIAYSESINQQIVLSHSCYGDIPLSMLSDGLRNAIIMVADIAFRCIKLNPHYGADATLKTSGIVMIDEVDMFLHPAWQQTIIGSLTKAFPKIQFIVTTHSPQVISTVDSDCIRIFKGGNVYKAPKGTKGAKASRVLKRVLGVDIRPPEDENTKLLEKYKNLIYTDRWEEQATIDIRKKLDDIYEDEEPDLTEVDLYIENKKWELEIEKDK